MPRTAAASLLARALMVISAIDLLGCSREPAPVGVTTSALSAAQVRFVVQLPATADAARIVIGASDHITVADRSVIESNATVTQPPIVANTGQNQVLVGADAVVRGDVVSGGSVLVGSRSLIAGNVVTSGTFATNGATVSGSITEHQPFPVAPTSWTVDFPATSVDVTVEPDQSRTIGPGAFANVNVKSRSALTLNGAGTYLLDSLNVEPGGQVVLAGGGAFTIYVRTSLALKGPLARPSGLTAAPTLLAYAGSNPVYLAAPFVGGLVAPAATITLADIGSAVHEAAFFAKAVEFQASVHIRHRPLALGPPETLAIPAAGGTLTCQLVDQSTAKFGGNAAATSSLTGTVSLTIQADSSVRLTGLNLRGSRVCAGTTCSSIVLQTAAGSAPVGTVSAVGGAMHLTIHTVTTFTDVSAKTSPVSLTFDGQLQHRTLSGFATSTLPGDAPMFAGSAVSMSLSCGEVEPNQIAEFALRFSETGSISAEAVRFGREIRRV
jgi:carbonic anhydrase/acetyltransferase-like protein (isoleucine patch superfamily)